MLLRKALVAGALSMAGVVAPIGVAAPAHAYSYTCTYLGGTSEGSLWGCHDTDGDVWLEIR